jgi:hypothetical protein
MSILEGHIPAGETGKNLDTTIVETNEGQVHREAVFVADPENPDARVKVTDKPPSTFDYGQITRPILPLTAFGDLRVTELSPIFQISYEYTVSNTEIGEISIVNSGIVTQADAMCVVSTGITTGSHAEWEIAKHARYRAGLGGLARFTALFTSGVAGTEQMIGLADVNGSPDSHMNGYAVGFDGDVFSLMRWQNGVLFTIPQSQWDDPMDGTGASKMTLDPTKLNVYFIQFQYLGGGPYTLWIQDEATSVMIAAHTAHYTNRNITPSIHNPNLHLMIHAQNRATTSNMIIKSSSMAFFVEGKTKFTELQQPQFSSNEQTKNSVTTEIAIFTIRNKTTYAGKINFIDIVLENVSGSIEASSANNLGNIRLVKDATLGGTPSFSDISTTNSIVEIDTAGTTVTGGKTLESLSLAGKNDRIGEGNLLNYEVFISAGETITVAASSANSATIKSSLLWKELF